MNRQPHGTPRRPPLWPTHHSPAPIDSRRATPATRPRGGAGEATEDGGHVELDEPVVLRSGPRAQMHQRARTEHEAERGCEHGRARPGRPSSVDADQQHSDRHRDHEGDAMADAAQPGTGPRQQPSDRRRHARWQTRPAADTGRA